MTLDLVTFCVAVKEVNSYLGFHESGNYNVYPVYLKILSKLAAYMHILCSCIYISYIALSNVCDFDCT